MWLVIDNFSIIALIKRGHIVIETYVGKNLWLDFNESRLQELLKKK